jgi:hypothetical protein
MLPLAKNNLRRARRRALFFLFVLYQVGTSHFLVAPAYPFPN